MDTIKPLVLVTNDRDLLSVVPWIQGEVCRAGSLGEADAFLGFYRGTAALALGFDVLLDAGRQGWSLPNYPYVLLYPAGRLAEVKFPNSSIKPENTFVLPLELDFLHARLGQFRPVKKNGRKAS